MSRLELNKIITSHSANDPNNYVAGIVNSESGPLSPILITDANELNSLFDDFEYKAMYNRLLSHDIPSVLVPILTKVSQYNRSSIRINDKDAYVEYTYPRINKKYDYKRQGNIVVSRSSSPIRSLDVTTLSKFPISYLLVNSNNEVVSHDICTANYYQVDSGYFKIHFEFNQDWIGNIITASYPSYEVLPGFCIPEDLTQKLIVNSESYASFPLANNIVPDFVILDDNWNEIPNYDAYIEKLDDEYIFNIKLLNSGSGNIYIRKLTEDMVASQMLTQEISNIYHNLGYYPDIKELNYEDNIIKLVSPISNSNQIIRNITPDELEITSNEINYPTYIEYLTNGITNKIYTITTPARIFSVSTTNRYHSPYLLLVETENGYRVQKATAKYSFNSSGKSVVTFNLPTSIKGMVIISSLNDVTNLGSRVFTKAVVDEASFELDYNVLPLITCTDDTGNQINAEYSIHKNGDKYICTIKTGSVFPCTAWVQILDERITVISNLITKPITEIDTGLDYNPYSRALINREGELTEYSAEVNYNSIDSTSDKSFSVTVSNYKSPTSIQYCILLETDTNKIDVDQLALNEVTYSMVLDFTNCTDINPNNIKDLYNHYLLLKINGVRVLYIRIVNVTEPVVSNDYYDELVTLSSNTITGIIDELKADISSRITEDNVIHYRDECLKSLQNAWKYATDEVPQGEPTISAGVSYDPITNTLTTTNDWSGVKYQFSDDFNDLITELRINTNNAKLRVICSYLDNSQTEYNDLAFTNERKININEDKLLSSIEVISLIPGSVTFNSIELTSVNEMDETSLIELDPDNLIADDFSENAFYDWKELLFEKLYEQELFLGSYKVFTNFIENNLMMNTDLSTITQLIINSNEFSINKLLINYRFPSSNLNFYKFDGFKLYTCDNSEQDVLCEFTEDSKLIEFYSRIKGPKGRNTTITINELSDYYYEIRIQLDSIMEYYNVYTKKTEDTPDDAEDIHIITSKSQLVDVKIFDYILPSGQLIDQYDFLDYDDMDRFDPNRVKVISLPSGTYKLGRNFKEEADYNDWRSTLSDLSESGYYPDLFLVPELFEHNELQQYKDITSYVRGSDLNIYGGVCSNGVHTQALCTVNWDYLQNPNPDKFPDSSNRMLYFYGDLELDNEQYPTFYPYIESFIKGTGLEIPNELILTIPNEVKVGNTIVYHNQPYLIVDIMSNGNLYCIDPNGGYSTLNPKYCTKITTLLDKLKINYLDYNGLYYYHTTWKEKLGQPSSFIVQYSCSKVSREFYKSHGVLVSTNYDNIQNPIINLISRILNIVPYINTVSYELDYKDRLINIKLSVVLKGLINKKFLVDYILNLF